MMAFKQPRNLYQGNGLLVPVKRLSEMGNTHSKPEVLRARKLPSRYQHYHHPRTVDVRLYLDDDWELRENVVHNSHYPHELQFEIHDYDDREPSTRKFQLFGTIESSRMPEWPIKYRVLSINMDRS